MPSSDSLPFSSQDPTPKPEPGSNFFSGFYETWVGKQNLDLEALIVAVNRNTELSQFHTESTQSVTQLVDRVMGHYESYYRVKSESVKKEPVHMLTPPWLTHLENAFLWMGGWRPTMAFHLLYSISGIQLEAGLGNLMKGLKTGDLADLSTSQLNRVNELQSQTIKSERMLAETLAAHQETVADSTMVKLSHLTTELTRGQNSVTLSDSVGERVDSALAGKEVMLAKILVEADELRLNTLKGIVEILDPIQAAHFLISAAELHLRVLDWGLKKDGLVGT